MKDKREDNFFDEKTADDEASEQLVKMIDEKNKSVRTDVGPGTKVTGKVTRIGADYCFVDIGAKNEAVMSIAEVKNKDGTLSVGLGDELTAYVVSDSSSETVLSKSLVGRGRTAATQELLDAMNSRVPVQGKVTGVAKAGITAKVLGHRAFCPV